MITFSKLRIEGKFPNLIKSIYKRTIANIILNSERLNAFSLRLEEGKHVF